MPVSRIPLRFLLIVFLFCTASVSSPAQTIINQYAAVLSHATTGCSNTFTVDDATGFATGDTILMMQMKGAVIDSGNNASFGNVLAYNGAGNYELNVVSAVSGNNISLVYQVARSYDIPAGKVQFVRVACYPSYTVSTLHSCMAWNGTKGGVFAVRISGTLTLNADVDVSGKGFAGATAYNSQSPNVKCVSDYAFAPSIDSGARRGQSIADVSVNKSYGRGKIASGGGGGDAHNAGGGGGSNGGTAGKGGPSFWGCNGNNRNPPGTNTAGGLGGAALSYSTAVNKIFLGGGGGAGHANNSTPSDGGTGGAIIYVMARSINSPLGRSLISNGLDAPVCINCTSGYGDGNDGAGGGGGGGGILLDNNSVSGSINAICKGGKGADVYLSVLNGDMYGEGGGGGGGVVWVSGAGIPSGMTVNTAGGANGVNVYSNNTCWGSTPGSAGNTLTNLNIPLPTLLQNNSLPTAAFADTLISCLSYQFTSKSTAVAGIAAYKWDFGGGSTSTAANPSFTFPSSGTYTVMLTVTDNNGCTASVSKTVVVVPSLPLSFTDSLLSCFTHQFINTSPASVSSFKWDFGTGATSTAKSPVYTFPATGTYTIKLSATDANGCVASVSKTVVVKSDIHADFSWAPSFPEVGHAVQFSNGSSGGANHFLWSFGDGSAGSTVVSPSHTYNEVDSYRVCLRAADNNGGCADSICRIITVDVPVSIGVPSAFTPNGDGVNDVLLIRGSGITDVHLLIFNRWGQKVFESNNQGIGWDGTFNGTPQEIDIYAYLLNATFYNGKTVSQKGNINLIR